MAVVGCIQALPCAIMALHHAPGRITPRIIKLFGFLPFPCTTMFIPPCWPTLGKVENTAAKIAAATSTTVLTINSIALMHYQFKTLVVSRLGTGG
jgi:hypothetical protein